MGDARRNHPRSSGSEETPSPLLTEDRVRRGLRIGGIVWGVIALLMFALIVAIVVAIITS